MKNKKGFYIRSAACVEAEAEGKEKIAFRCPESEARGIGVEWHHAGSGIIGFFPMNDEERERIFELRDALANRGIKSKRAAVEYLKTTSGSYKIPYKMGKYGVFFNFWGKPDGEYSISPNDINFEDVRSLLNV